MMGSLRLQIAGCTLALLGWIGVLIVCGTPMWRVKLVHIHITWSWVTMWEGLWMACITQIEGQRKCKVYNSKTNVSQDLQGAQVLVVVSIILGLAGVLVTFASLKRTKLISDNRARVKASISGGVLLIISGFLCLIPISWTASIIIGTINNRAVYSSLEKEQLGASLYIGWGAGALLVLGGALLCANCPKKNEDTAASVKYILQKSTLDEGDYTTTSAV